MERHDEVLWERFSFDWSWLFLLNIRHYYYQSNAYEFSHGHAFNIAASNLEFDDSEKQRIYNTISFEEIHNEIIELKVVSPFIVVLPSIIISFLLVYLSVKIRTITFCLFLILVLKLFFLPILHWRFWHSDCMLG